MGIGVAMERTAPVEGMVEMRFAEMVVENANR
jgi:hypothetical protein